MANAREASALATKPVAAAAQSSSGLPGEATRNSRAEIDDLVRRINRHRAAQGRRVLIWDERLAAVARRHSEDMSRRRFFDHTNPDGDDPFDRMRYAGLRFWAAAENLAAGQTTGEEVFEGWMNSKGHRRNLEDGGYVRIGVGLYRRHWTCLMARLVSDP